ncbi:MAG: hypothetical protein AAGK97_09485 [Bacteroidota bacterium]
MASLKKDIQRSSKWLVKAFSALDKDLDFSVKSVEHIEDLPKEQFVDGQAKADGLFAKGLGEKLFAISSYIGEVVIRNTSATKWITDDKDPQGEINIKLVSANGTEMYPAHRVLKRIQNGEEDNLYHYTAIAVKKYMHFEGTIPEGFLEPKERSDKPWWKFW